MTYSFTINGLSGTRDRSDDVAVVKTNSDTGTGSHNSCEPWSNDPRPGFDSIFGSFYIFFQFIYMFSLNNTAKCEKTKLLLFCNF